MAMEPNLKQAAADAFENDPALMQALDESVTSESEALSLWVNLHLLAGRRDRALWPSEDALRAMTHAEMLIHAAECSEHFAALDAAGEMPLRDSCSMVREVIHASGDPQVLGNDPDAWLWGPSGPPASSDPLAVSRPSPDGMYAAHAAAIGRRWDDRTAAEAERVEESYYTDRISPDHPAALKVYPALDGGYRTIEESDEALAEGISASHTLPELWPPEMAEWSDAGWGYADSLRLSVRTVMVGASCPQTALVVNEARTYEDRGLGAASVEARLAALMGWWVQIAPARDPGSEPVSYWHCDTSPVGFWAAALVAAMCEHDSAVNGGGAEGLAKSLISG